MGSDRRLEAAGGLVARELGKYRLLAVIGRGGMGEVYLAMARGPAGFRKLVVLKCMNAASADDAQLRKMFLDEAMLAARLSHPNVVQTYEAGELEGTPYIAMEYLEGQPLSRLMQGSSELEPRMAAHVISEALAGLHYAHHLKDFDGSPLALVHRDLSPPNIFVTYDGVVKVVDFGVAKTAMASRTKTDANVFKGKIAYTAPEQAMHEEVDHRADIFSLGAVLWELLAGRRLFREISPLLTLKRLLQDEIPTLSSAKPNVDPALEAIVMRALQRNPAARYQTAQQMRQDLEHYVRTGLPMNWDADLASLMSEQFARQRARVQRQIKLCMTEEAEAAGRLPSVSLSDSLSSSSIGSDARAISSLVDAPPPLLTITQEDTDYPSAYSVRPPAISESASRIEALSGRYAPVSSGRRRLGWAAVGVAVIASLTTAAAIVLSSESSVAPAQTASDLGRELRVPLEVLSTPPGAIIFIDGEPSGLVTPATVSGLAEGRVLTLRVDKAGYRGAEQQLTVKGPVLSRSFVLTPVNGAVRFEGAPADVRIFVDDVAVSSDEAGLIHVLAGAHALRLEAGGSLLFARTVEIVSGEQVIQVADTRSGR